MKTITFRSRPHKVETTRNQAPTCYCSHPVYPDAIANSFYVSSFQKKPMSSGYI